METSKEQTKNKYNDITEKYFSNHEEINEVKLNLFFILSKDFRLDYKNYKDFVDQENKIKIQRLTLQRFSKLENNSIKFEAKKYSFIPIAKRLFFHMEKTKLKLKK